MISSRSLVTTSRCKSYLPSIRMQTSCATSVQWDWASALRLRFDNEPRLPITAGWCVFTLDLARFYHFSIFVLQDATLWVQEATLWAQEATLCVEEATLWVEEAILWVLKATSWVQEATMWVQEATLIVSAGSHLVSGKPPREHRKPPCEHGKPPSE